MKEKMTLMSVSKTGQAQRGQGGALGPKAVSSDDKNRIPVVPWDGGVQRVRSRRQRKEKAGVIPIYRQASWPVIELDSDGA